jgi:CubicO group peptidase (beta-lactamase class C family)
MIDAIRRRGAAAQLYVERHGTVLVDEAYGCRRTSLFWTFSAGKPLLAVLVHRLAERGELNLDEPVAARWPGFGRYGKGLITPRHLLRHRSGLPARLGDLLVMTDWRRSVRRAERTRPRWAPGAVPAYLPVSSGFILGELVQRATGAALPGLLAGHILGPAGLGDTHLGLPGTALPRRVPLHVDGRLGWLVGAALNRRATRRAVIPAAGVSTTARDLGRFYRALLDGTLLRPQTLAAACAPTSDGELDRHARAYIRWSEGFQLGGARVAPGAVPPMGRRSSARTFGHNGSSCCIGWADPDRDLVVAYLTDRLEPRRSGALHMAAVADEILAAAG